MSLFRKRFKQRIKISIRNFFRSFSSRIDLNSEKDLNLIQKQAIVNVRRIMSKKDSVLLLAPISGVCYIEWKHYFVRLGETQMTITNGKFSYYIWLPNIMMDKLKTNFYKMVESRKQKLEESYDETTLENLRNIARELDSI
jgi:hypothetical protein